MRSLTAKQNEVIQMNLKAFICNFGPVRIERPAYGTGFYVYYPADDEKYTHYCPSIDYLNGWLYGAVQGVHVIACRGGK